jgi:SAM-dependent methyltransferase
MDLLNREQIKEMWDERARETAASSHVTHRDLHQRRLEVSELVRHLRPSDVVLDMGCGNGWATAQMAAHCRRITGADYSEDMISRARMEHANVASADWVVADVLDFAEEGRYDVVTTVRCLINIVDPDLQRKAIANLQRSLKPGGTFLMMEGVRDGRLRIDELRQQLGLPSLGTVVHNLDFPIAETSAFLRTLFRSVEYVANGLFDLVTRVLYPWLIRPETPVYGSPFHEAAERLCEHLPGYPELSRFGLFKCVK